MSKKLFLNNAYGILGFDASATEREVIRRQKEIEALLRIGNCPDYEYDVIPENDYRTEKNAADAAQRLLSLDKVIKENFFWFYIKDSADKRAVKLFREKKFTDALEVLKSKTVSSKSTIALRNLAVFESLVFSVSHTKKFLNASLKSWKAILDSDKQWSDFEKIITLNNPNISHENVEVFRKNVGKYLSGFYSDIAKESNKPEIFAAYSQAFSKHANDAIEDVIAPMVEIIRETSKSIEEFGAEVYVRNGLACLKQSKVLEGYMDALNAAFARIEQLGDVVYNSSIATTYRDEAAMTVNKTAAKIFNNIPDDTDVSKSLRVQISTMLEDAYNFCSAKSLTEEHLKKARSTFAYSMDSIAHRDDWREFDRNMRMGYTSLAIRSLDKILMDLSICEEYRADLEKIREKFSYNHEKEPDGYYQALAESDDGDDDTFELPEAEDEEEDESEEEGGYNVTKVSVLERKLDKTTDPTDIAIGFMIAIVISGVIVGAIIGIVALIVSLSTSNRISSAERECNKYGLESYTCKSSQKKNDVKCDYGLENGEYVVKCEVD